MFPELLHPINDTSVPTSSKSKFVQECYLVVQPHGDSSEREPRFKKEEADEYTDEINSEEEDNYRSAFGYERGHEELRCRNVRLDDVPYEDDEDGKECKHGDPQTSLVRPRQSVSIEFQEYVRKSILSCPESAISH